MTQVSRKKLDVVLYKRVQELFYDAVIGVSSVQEAKEFVADFLTPAERIMLPKRLTIAYLLTKGFEHRTIAAYLCVSLTTINRVSTAMKNGGKGYNRVIKRLLEDTAMVAFLSRIDEAIGTFIGAGMPVGLGASSWSAWYKKRAQNRKQIHRI